MPNGRRNTQWFLVKKKMQEETGQLFVSQGELHYEQKKIIVVVDPEIVRFYRSLIPKWIYVAPQMYPPHISVVSKETPQFMEFWGKYEQQKVEFSYSQTIRHGQVYWWLNAFSTRLEAIRSELGLSVVEEYTRPPIGFTKTFHISLGNNKCFFYSTRSH
jgi:hypothetical protein